MTSISLSAHQHMECFRWNSIIKERQQARGQHMTKWAHHFLATRGNRNVWDSRYGEPIQDWAQVREKKKCAKNKSHWLLIYGWSFAIFYWPALFYGNVNSFVNIFPPNAHVQYTNYIQIKIQTVYWLLPHFANVNRWHKIKKHIHVQNKW